MATMHNDFSFTGSIGNITAYRLQGSNKVYLRTKGGATKQKIKTHPHFAHTRALNREFAGRVWAAKQLLQCIAPLKGIVNYNLMAAFNRLCYQIQLGDKAHPVGERAILFSMFQQYLPGFQCNKRFVFDQVIQSPLPYSLDRNTLTAKVHVGSLLPNIHLVLPWLYSYYRFTLVLSIIRDWTSTSDQHNHTQMPTPIHINSISTEWYAAAAPFPGATWQLQIDRDMPLQTQESLLLSIGIEAGNPLSNQLIMPVKYMGAGKIMAVV
ncbi:MAG: hypothetical protein KGK14_04230 [Bacteroidota bacterium]|nr:hypothetical protein [Bacteroidota bacterium]